MNIKVEVFKKAFLGKVLFLALTLNGIVTTATAQELFSFFGCQPGSGDVPTKRVEIAFSSRQIRGIIEYDVLTATNMIRTRWVGDSTYPSKDLSLFCPSVQNSILSRTNLFQTLARNRTYFVRPDAYEIHIDIRDEQDKKVWFKIYGDATTNAALIELNAFVERTILWLYVKYPEHAQCITQRFERATVPARDVTISQVLQNPSAYHGKRVRVSGYYQNEFESSAISEHYPEKTKRYPYEQSLWLGGYMKISEIGELKAEVIGKVLGEAANTRRKIWMEGLIVTDKLNTDLYNTKSKGVGHLGLWNVAIDDLSNAGFAQDE